MGFISNRYSEAKFKDGETTVETWLRAYHTRVWQFTVVTGGGKRTVYTVCITPLPCEDKREHSFSYTYHEADVAVVGDRCVVRCTCGSVSPLLSPKSALTRRRNHTRKHHSNGE